MPPEESPVGTYKQPSDDGIDMAELAQVLWGKRNLIATVAGIFLVISAGISLMMPNVYTSQASLIPMDSGQDKLAGMLGSLGALSGLASDTGMGMGIGKATTSDKFIAILNSRTLTENVVTHYNLMPLLFPEKWDASSGAWKEPSGLFAWIGSLEGESNQNHSRVPTLYDARRKMETIFKVKSNPKSGLIEISIERHDPNAAAVIANAYLVELSHFLLGTTLGTAKRNRIFLQGQVDQVKREMAAMEIATKEFQEKNKLVSLDAQATASVQAYATLQAQLLAKEMDLNLQKTSAPENDMDVIAAEQEVAQLKDKLNGLENGKSAGFISFKDAPTLGLKFARLKRDLSVKQHVFELLTQQLELAKVTEADEALSFEVIDHAIPADRKSKPMRSLIVLLGTFVGLLLGSFAAMIVAKQQKIG